MADELFKRVADGELVDVYVRVSSVEQGSGYGPKEQLALAREVIEEAGGRLGEVYEDHVSGRSLQKRLAMQRLLARKRAGDRRPVVVPRIDRLARNERDFHNAVDELVALNVPLHFAEDQITTSQTDDEWRSKIGADVASAATFSRKLSGRVRRSLKTKRRETNGIAGGKPPFGYRWTADARSWEPVREWDPVQYPPHQAR